MNEPKHIRFSDSRPSKSGKTKIWLVVSKYDISDFLGEIRWFGRWRCYAFYPMPTTVFEKTCLRDIANFCEEQTRLHKEKSA
jgi:hypothetical protein